MLIIDTIFGYWFNDFKTKGIYYVKGCVKTTYTEFWAIDSLAAMYVDILNRCHPFVCPHALYTDPRTGNACLSCALLRAERLFKQIPV